MPSIYKTPDGAILKNPDGKIIKQPHDFGFAFQNRMGINNYIRISNVSNLNNYGQSLVRLKNTAIAGVTDIAVGIITSNNDTYNLCFANPSYFISKNYVGANSYYKVTNSLNVQNALDISLLYWILSNNGVNSIYLNAIISNNTFELNNLFNLKSINIGAGASSLDGVVNVYTDKILFNRYILLNRILTPGEEIYFYNNKLGNELQSTTGVDIDIHFNKAEILDFSALQNGSDMRVGCRDNSGYNRHGEIMNLPAGTLQQKLDFANANLFVLFQ